jgi:CubicO group peptidase (beta-lactamase class C family)
VDWIDLLALPTWPFKISCELPRDLDQVTAVAAEAPPEAVGVRRADLDRVWDAVRALYRTALYPALQICIRRRGAIVLDRALGYASGGCPGDPPDAPKVPATPKTPFLLYSASKAVTAMLIHKLDDQGVLHIGDLVCDYLPEFTGAGKESITIAHVLCHRAGVPNLPPGGMNLRLLARPEIVLELLCEAPLISRPGRRLAYHAVTGGFILGEVVRAATGQDIRSVLRKEIQEPLGLRWMNYGVAPEDVGRVAADAVTGIPPFPPVAQLFRRALGTDFERAVTLAQDPRFRTGIVPAANVVATAEELSLFYECLRCDGEVGDVRVFEPRTVHRARAEQSYWELDLTLGMPLRYGMGFMLGARVLSLFGPDTTEAFGHLGFTNIFSWADPERETSVALLTSGKPLLNPELIRLMALILEIGRAFPKRA